MVGKVGKVGFMNIEKVGKVGFANIEKVGKVGKVGILKFFRQITSKIVNILKASSNLYRQNRVFVAVFS